MAPKRPVSAAVGSVVRRTRRLVQETVEVSVIQEKDVAAEEKVVVEVEIEEKAWEQPPEVTPPAVKGEDEVPTPQPSMPAAEEESEEEETQPPLESEKSYQRGEEKQHVEEEVRSSEERQASVEANGGLKGEKQPAEEEEKEKKAAEGKMEGKEGEEGEEKGKKGRGRRRRRRRKVGGEAGGGAGGGRGYKRYVFRVLKQVHPELRVSSMAMTVLDSLMKDMFERIVDEATRLSKYSGKATLSSREIQGAVRLVLPGELGKHAEAEGTKAVANYIAAEKAGV